MAEHELNSAQMNRIITSVTTDGFQLNIFASYQVP